MLFNSGLHAFWFCVVLLFCFAQNALFPPILYLSDIHSLRLHYLAPQLSWLKSQHWVSQHLPLPKLFLILWNYSFLTEGPICTILPWPLFYCLAFLTFAYHSEFSSECHLLYPWLPRPSSVFGSEHVLPLSKALYCMVVLKSIFLFYFKSSALTQALLAIVGVKLLHLSSLME